jgi:hypothetical protein
LQLLFAIVIIILRIVHSLNPIIHCHLLPLSLSLPIDQMILCPQILHPRFPQSVLSYLFVFS